MADRKEHDFLGQVDVPDGVYYGAHTKRALDNFPRSKRIHPALLKNLANYKIAAARANWALKLLEAEVAESIEKAAQEVIRGWLDEHFEIGYLQAGAGTPWNMNINEVLANRATEIMGGKKGEYLIHPNDHVNMCQSTNNIIPTVMRLTVLELSKDLLDSLRKLEESYFKKAKVFDKVITSGRTHLQDAVPIKISQEFHAWGTSLSKCHDRIQNASKDLHFINTGGSAIGTGINVHPKFAGLVLDDLRKLTHLPLELTLDPIESTNSMADLVEFHSSLKVLAIELIRLCNDLRLLASGPHTGIHELDLPAVEAGSSIMPGKVNPSIPECMTMICFEVLGNEEMISLCAQNGQLQLNVWMPLMAQKLAESASNLAKGMDMLREKCIVGITVNKKAAEYYFEHSQSLATILNPFIGYESASEIAKESAKTGKSIRGLILEKKLMPKDQLDKLLDPNAVTKPNL